MPDDACLYCIDYEIPAMCPPGADLTPPLGGRQVFCRFRCSVSATLLFLWGITSKCTRSLADLWAPQRPSYPQAPETAPGASAETAVI